MKLPPYNRSHLWRFYKVIRKLQIADTTELFNELTCYWDDAEARSSFLILIGILMKLKLINSNKANEMYDESL